MKVICLTGGLASGKSTAARYLADLGAKIIDADKLGHRAYDPGTATYDAVIETFGEELVDENRQIDRKILGGKVFGNPDALKKLTDIVWPEIRRLAEEEIRSSNANDIIVLEAAVLFEAGWEDIGDEIWVIVVDREIAIERCLTRDGLDRAAVESRLNSQISNDERKSRSNVVIVNNKTEADLIAQLDEQWRRLTT